MSSASDLTLIVNRKSVAIPADKWQMVAAKPAYSALRVMQDFAIRDVDGNEQTGNAGDYIVELSGGPCVIVPAPLFAALFREIGGAPA